MGEGEPTTVWAVLKRWLGPVPRWPYLAGGAVVVAIGLLIEHVDVLQPLDRFANEALRQVGAFSPLSLASTFLRHGENCSDILDIKGDYVRTVCQQWGILHPGRAVDALYQTIRDVLGQPNIAAAVILLVALVAGFVVVFRFLTAKVFPKGDGGPFPFLLSVLAAPFVGSCIAFVLQLVGIVFFTVCGAVIGFLIWITTQTLVVLALFKAGRAVQENAALLKHIDDHLRPPPP
jgi:hypothetical protein